MEAVPDPRGGGGQKGHMPPEGTTRHTLPQEKKLIFDLMTPKSSLKKWYQCELLILIQYNTYAITECKNGRALVKHGNILPLIRYQTTPHCDAPNSRCQIEP